jgi:flavin-dependent dehydrogenase
MAFLYLLAGDRALLSAYLPQNEFAAWSRNEREMLLRAMFTRDELVPDLSDAQLDGRLIGFRHYPNQIRAADHAGAFFVGDAAISLDPMSGVGCGYAMVSAAMAVELIAEHLHCRTAGVHPEAAARYRQRLEAMIMPHATGIMADSLIARSPEATRAVYRRIVASPVLQRAFIALTGRIVPPATLQQAFLGALRRPRAA